MKLTSVELHPDGSSDFVSLSFKDPTRQLPYNIKSIAGLDADNIIYRRYSDNFNAPSLESRNVVLRFGLNPKFSLGESFATLRDRIYKMIAASRTGLVQVQFKNESVVVGAVSGFVTKLEAPHFERDQEIILTINCEDPIIRAIAPVEVDVTDLDPANTVITDSLSTAPHGFKFELEFVNPYSQFSINDPDDGAPGFIVIPVGGFLAGDVLNFSSEHNDVYIYVVRAGNEIHLADVIVSGSVWPIIFPGENNFVVDGAANVEWVSISHYPTYWGV